jgi:Polymorphic toxin system, DSP-PTPase phosphatase
MTSYPIDGPWPGQLAIIPRPRGGDWLQDEVVALKTSGFDIVISLLTDNEMQELGLTNEAELIRVAGLQFYNYPIRDLSVPDSRDSSQQFLEVVYKHLLSGKRIAIHCRGSIGRSGLLASGLLVLSGVDPADAFDRVSDARGLSAPETAEQKDWVTQLSTGYAKSLV